MTDAKRQPRDLTQLMGPSDFGILWPGRIGGRSVLRLLRTESFQAGGLPAV